MSLHPPLLQMGKRGVRRAEGSWPRRIMVGAGAFLIVAGVLLHFYAAPALIAAPDGINETITLDDPHGTYFNESTLKTVSGAPLTYVSTIRGDASAGTSTLAVWDFSSVLEDLRHHAVIQNTYQRAAFNRRTAQLVNCCGASVNDDTSVRQYGVAGLYWPIGLRKTTYQVYDVATERDWPAVYSGTAVVQGIAVYKFVQRVQPTVVQKIPGVPISILGIPGPSYNVTANRTYHAVNTYWIDPRTGVPIDVEEQITSTLSDPAGVGSLTVASADLKLAPSAQAIFAGLSKSTAVELTVLRTIGPLVGIILGALLFIAALVPYRRTRRPEPGTCSDPGSGRGALDHLRLGDRGNGAGGPVGQAGD